MKPRNRVNKTGQFLKNIKFDLGDLCLALFDPLNPLKRQKPTIIQFPLQRAAYLTPETISLTLRTQLWRILNGLGFLPHLALFLLLTPSDPPGLHCFALKYWEPSWVSQIASEMVTMVPGKDISFWILMIPWFWPFFYIWPQFWPLKWPCIKNSHPLSKSA